MKLLVGCPVSRREWILESWFWHVAVACQKAGLSGYETVFVVAADDPSLTCLRDAAAALDVPLRVVDSGEPARQDERCWDRPGRYAHMATLRNRLLEQVRAGEPDLFLSLDSDVLVHQDALAEMIDLVDCKGFGAASTKTYMTRRGTRAPNYGQVLGYGGLWRPDTTAIIAADVIMAIKLMTPAAYHVDYVPDGNAEDLGWCAAARAAGVSFGWSGRVCSKHVMSPELLDVVDERCGY